MRCRACLRDPKVVVGGGFILFLLVLALGAPWIAPQDPLEQDIILGATPPVWLSGAEPGHWLGTDDLGRDTLSRVIYGSRIALTGRLRRVEPRGLLGSALGLLAGWHRGWVDATISRLVEIWMAFPPVLLSILLVAVVGAGRRLRHRGDRNHRLDAVLPRRARRDHERRRAPTTSPPRARSASRSGASSLREIFPNVLPVLIALVSLEMGIAVIVEAILSFVGLSVSSDTPDLGRHDRRKGGSCMHEGWWILAAPLTMLFLTVLAFNMLGEGLRRALDPVMRR